MTDYLNFSVVILQQHNIALVSQWLPHKGGGRVIPKRVHSIQFTYLLSVFLILTPDPSSDSESLLELEIDRISSSTMKRT